MYNDYDDRGMMRPIGGYSRIMFSGVGRLRRGVFGGRTDYMWGDREDT